jgi:AcrR family transcriptional regulator
VTSSEPHDHVAAEPGGNGRAVEPDTDELESEKPRTLRAQQKADTRRRLLEAATEVFLETGPNTPLEVVAERAGVSKATLFFHFGTRVELLDRLAGHLYRRVFPSQPEDDGRSDLATFVQDYLDRQEDPEARLVWQIGDLIGAERPERLDAGYWHLVEEIELRLLDADLSEAAARERALVVAPALMLVARRATQGLTTPDELGAFAGAACQLALAATADIA